MTQPIEGPFSAVLVAGPPTQVQHSWRATLRTVLQYVLAVAVALPVIIPGILEATDGTPVKKYVAIAAGYVLVAIGVITKIMAIPIVNEWLTKIGIGAAPAGALLPVVVDAPVMTAAASNAAAGDSPGEAIAADPVADPAGKHEAPEA